MLGIFIHILSESSIHMHRNPQFERYTSISEAGTPIGPVEIWVPLEPLANE
jgi:hypothetical protein